MVRGGRFCAVHRPPVDILVWQAAVWSAVPSQSGGHPRATVVSCPVRYCAPWACCEVASLSGRSIQRSVALGSRGSWRPRTGGAGRRPYQNWSTGSHEAEARGGAT